MDRKFCNNKDLYTINEDEYRVSRLGIRKVKVRHAQAMGKTKLEMIAENAADRQFKKVVDQTIKFNLYTNFFTINPKDAHLFDQGDSRPSTRGNQMAGNQRSSVSYSEMK